MVQMHIQSLITSLIFSSIYLRRCLAICSDSTGTFNITKVDSDGVERTKQKTCDWVNNRFTKSRCKNIPGVKEACPLTCTNCFLKARTISLIGETIDVAFNASRLNNEIMMDLNITTDFISDLSDPIKVFDYDTCRTTEYDSSMLGASAITNASVPDADTDGVFSVVPLAVDLNITDIMRFNDSTLYPGFFNAQDEAVIIQFCLKPTVGSSEVYRDGVAEQSHISYTKIKVQITLNMTMDFSTAAVTIEEHAPTESTGNVNVEYVLEAYECDAATKLRIDTPSIKSQNSLVTVCIESTFDAIVVRSIKELTLTQTSSGLTFKAIDDSVPNYITEVSSSSSKKLSVTTLLVGVFFADIGDDISTINITGIAVLEFSSGARNLVRIGNSAENQQTFDRDLGANDDPLGNFAVSVGISRNNDAASAANQAKRVFAALFSAIMGSALVL